MEDDSGERAGLGRLPVGAIRSRVEMYVIRKMYMISEQIVKVQ